MNKLLLSGMRLLRPIILFALLLTESGLPADQAGWWQPQNPAELQEAARREGKPVWLVTISDHCGACQTFKHDLLDDPILALVTDAYAVKAMANTSTAQGKKVMAPFPWRGTPNSFLLDGQNNQLARFNGAYYFAYHWLTWLRDGGARLTPQKAEELYQRCQELADRTPTLTPTGRATLAWLCLHTAQTNGNPDGEHRRRQALRYFGPPYLPLIPNNYVLAGMAEFWSDPELQTGPDGRAIGVEAARRLVQQSPARKEYRRIYAAALAQAGNSAAAWRVYLATVPAERIRILLRRAGFHPARKTGSPSALPRQQQQKAEP